MDDLKQYLRKNRATLLTLPAAALWSLPCAVWLWPKVASSLPFGLSWNPLHALVFGAFPAVILFTGICSFFAMRIWHENRENYPRGVAKLLTFFNAFTLIVSGVASVIALGAVSAGWF